MVSFPFLFLAAYIFTQMVLDAGRLVEYDAPKALLQKEGGLLRALVDESADKDALYAMAEGKSQS